MGKRLCLLLTLWCAVVHSKVMMEIEFDIAEREESQGQSVAQILTSFISDPNLLWMRYLNTLLDGANTKTPSRIAFIEFQGPTQWLEFEKNQKGPAHVLFDIFWLHWRRTPWISDDSAPKFEPSTERETGKEGYVWTMKYTIKEEMMDTFRKLVETKLPDMVETLGQTEGVLSRSQYLDANFQSNYRHYIIYEFSSMDALAETQFVSNKLFEVLPEVMKCYSAYGASYYQPPYAKGGNILYGVSNKPKDEL